MALRKTAPYGRWTSAISAEAATAGTKTVTSPRAAPTRQGQECDRKTRGYFLVSQDDGRSTIYEHDAGDEDEDKDVVRKVLPEPWGVGTSVYEYGGQAYAVMGDGAIVFADPRDNGVYVLDVASGRVRTLVAGTPALRYGDFDAPPVERGGHDWVLAVQEDHTHPAPADVQNYIVAIHRTTGTVVRVVEGADFYSYPRWGASSQTVSATGAATQHTGLAWRQWNHPDLPFDGVTLHWAAWDASTNTLSQTTQVAGANRQCVAEAVWTPDRTSLVFGMEAAKTDAFRQLYRVRLGGPGTGGPSSPEPVVLQGLEDCEFGDASWRTIAFLTPTRFVAVATCCGQNHLVYADIDTGAWASLDADVGLVELKFDPLAALSASSFLVVGSGFTTPQAAYRVDLDVDACNRALDARSHTSLGEEQHTPLATRTRLFRSTEQNFDARLFSTPELICIPAPGAVGGEHQQATSATATHNVYGWFWPPHNRAFEAPDDTLPPLVITPHGGPTGYTAPGLRMMAQYWATRGFAYFAINYSGSSGHGRAYRDRLWTRWGLLDRDDVAAAAQYLTGVPGTGASFARADPRRVGIEGGSSGGYNVLQNLVHHPTLFAGGVCCCGVADTAALGRDTHKLESHYLERLLWPTADPDAIPSPAEQARIHRDRSPLLHADRIRAPLRLIHGERDTVVPLAQSRAILAQIQTRGGDADLIVLPGEGHLFAKLSSLVLYLNGEAAWWEKTLLAA
ncbi:peptidase s9 prolyl oligopeptidase active site domain containing protein [Sporothrix brasiliensis 5110]|uniref:Peptidase s9 prolyl oligopeptidase active site domain containing protein n=1 Tax=Sporothrix brasiliensis 5110 TaxID=1398154 RepID=A0A0C2IQ15_9PEZI|nr:peptidase s9 prolyl oligopeptidase active site domain containing protein [Sporothrix brasiliensis 5110]KIH87127.1 peptidase s9 prolyl oligopeptidase active site domain containing protein [Sporothrix brasiliensis 5110]